MITLEEMDEILRRCEEASARRLANMPGGGMIKPNDKYYGYFELTDEEEAEIRERFALLDAERK